MPCHTGRVECAHARLVSQIYSPGFSVPGRRSSAFAPISTCLPPSFSAARCHLRQSHPSHRVSRLSLILEWSRGTRASSDRYVLRAIACIHRAGLTNRDTDVQDRTDDDIVVIIIVLLSLHELRPRFTSMRPSFFFFFLS